MIPKALLVNTPERDALWRVVENQEQAATRRITQSAEEQSRLEELLDGNKPAYMPGTRHLHWLLKTPFRYPPLRHGSRFGSAQQPGILYGSRERHTALTESAVYLWLFRSGPVELGPLNRITDSRTALQFKVAHPRGSNLTHTRADRWRDKLSDPASYRFSQAVGQALRELESGAIWFWSARAEDGINCAVIDPQAVSRNTEPTQEHWQLHLDAGNCWWGRPGSESFEVSYASVSDSNGRIPHPGLA